MAASTTQFPLLITCIASVVHTMSLDSLVLQSDSTTNEDQMKTRQDVTGRNPLYWSQYLTPNEKGL